jgi:hypothetical protein
VRETVKVEEGDYILIRAKVLKTMGTDLTKVALRSKTEDYEAWICDEFIVSKAERPTTPEPSDLDAFAKDRNNHVWRPYVSGLTTTMRMWELIEGSKTHGPLGWKDLDRVYGPMKVYERSW